MNYLIIIADIVESKKIRQRKKFQNEFMNLINDLNIEYKDKIVSPLTITLGDEFQGMLNSAASLFLIIHKIQSFFNGITFRFALSVGGISTKINHQSAIGMDGMGFHQARTAMENNKREKRNFSYHGGQPEALLIDSMLKWMDQATKKWKPEKWKTVLLSQQGKSQKEIVKQINISQSAVSQNLKNKSTILVLETEKVIEQYLLKLIQNK